MSRRLLVAGFGDLGSRLARRLAPEDWQVTGLRRSGDHAGSSAVIVHCDLRNPLPEAVCRPSWDAVVFQATPDERSAAGYTRVYLDALGSVLAQVKCKRLVLVSSTAVYGQDDGAWVDEHAATAPVQFNGRILLQAEALAATHPGAVILRLSGIYGPRRERLIEQLRAGRAHCRPDPPQWTNRIHVDDAAAALAHVLDLSDPAPLYCVSDDEPAPRCQVLAWLARRLACPGPVPDTDGGGQGKRVSNRRLRASGLQLAYPDYRSGYTAVLA